jgi:anti-sigma B factor antagonist
MKVTARAEGEYFVVTVTQRLDAVTAPEFESLCIGWIDEGHSRLVIDMAALDYVSSAGLRSILSAAKRVQRMGGGLALCGPAGQVREVVEMAGFDRILPMHATVDDALSRD